VDKSERMIYYGEYSKKMFNEVLKYRDYDLYARRIHVEDENVEARKLLAAALGTEYRKIDNLTDKIAERQKIPEIFDNEGVKALPLTTPHWEIGKKEMIKPPVGFAADPTELSNSLGNEVYFPYRGQWKDGQMHGAGEYLYSDGKTYKGGFKKNQRDGIGSSTYVDGSEYSGHWEANKFHGKGKMQYIGGSVYDGEWREGFRSGFGKLSLPCGLEYEGMSCHSPN